MRKRAELNFWDCTGEILNKMRRQGLLCTVIDKAYNTNVLTMGWGQIGPFYHGHFDSSDARKVFLALFGGSAGICNIHAG